ncbi:MAG: APC family permease [Nitrososphaerota archaeon]|nr:APC family permease [Nitrososphaerota archaeon]MDG7024115.1 APC family permease [Nitrososphaerota archaeon]
MDKETPDRFTRGATGMVRELGAFDSFVFNFLSMNLFGVFILMVFAIGLYQSANIGISTALALVPALLIALVYVLMSVAMPRAGGDYVWVSRVIHPIVGFMVNFGFTFVLFTFISIDVTVFTQWGLGAYFYGVFVNTGSQGALNVFSTLNTPGSPLVFGIAVLLITLVTLAAAFGTRNALRIQKVAWVFVMFAVAVYLGLALSVGHSSFVNNFNSLSGTNETAIISAANISGFDPAVTLSGTLLGFVYMFLNFTGFNYSAYLSGEIKNVRRSQLIGIVASLLVFAGLLIVVIEVTESVFGYDFFHALNYLFDLIFFGLNPSAPYPSTLPPAFPEFLVGFLTSNPALVFIITMGFSLSVLINAVPYMQVSVRNMFAWSFDRSVPSALSRVEDRFHSPYVALIVTAVLSVLITYLSVFTTISLLFTYITFLFALLYFIVGITALALPFRRKGIFDGSPTIVSRKLGGLPVISILGFLAAISSLYVGYSLFTPAYSGPFVLQNFEVVLAVLFAPAVIYLVSYSYYRRKGLDLRLRQRELPPD